MSALVVLHADPLDPFLLALKRVIERAGGTVTQSQDFDDNNLHVVVDLDAQGKNVITVAPPVIPPFRTFDHPELKTSFDADAIPYPPAKAFLETLRADYALGRRYNARDLPDGMLVVCLSEPDFEPQHETTVHRMISDAMAMQRPVVLVNEDPLFGGNLGALTNYFPGVDVYHDDLADVLHKADAVVSRAGAGVVLAHIHRTPSVVYAPFPYDHASPLVGDAQPFAQALQAAFDTAGVHAKYLYWAFQLQGLRADAPEFADKVLASFAALGFDRKRLGLNIASKATDRISQTLEATQTLTQFFEATPEVAGITLTKALKVSEKSWVFKARLNGQHVVVKRFFEGDPTHTTKSLKGELDYISAVLGDGPYQVNRCLFAWPDAGTVMLTFVPGKRLFDELSTRKGADRAAMMTKAGGWLSAYVQPRHRQATFGPRFWFNKIDARAPAAMNASQTALLETARKALARLTQMTAGAPVTQAASHGDFAGINVLHHKGVVTGVDIQGECWLALAKDAATCVGWQALYDPQRTGGRIYGIDRADYDAFFAGIPLLDAEHTTTIPFFLGWQYVTWFLDGIAQEKDCAAEMRLLRDYLEDVEMLFEND